MSLTAKKKKPVNNKPQEYCVIETDDGPEGGKNVTGVPAEWVVDTGDGKPILFWPPKKLYSKAFSRPRENTPEPKIWEDMNCKILKRKIFGVVEMKALVEEKIKYYDTDEKLRAQKKEEFYRSHPLMRLQKRFNSDSSSLETENLSDEESKQTKKRRISKEDYDLNAIIEDRQSKGKKQSEDDLYAFVPETEPLLNNINHSDSETNCSQESNNQSGHLSRQELQSTTYSKMKDKNTQTEINQEMSQIGENSQLASMQNCLVSIENKISSLKKSMDERFKILAEYFKLSENKKLRILSEIKVDVNNQRAGKDGEAFHQGQEDGFDKSLIPLKSLVTFREFEESLSDASIKKKFMRFLKTVGGTNTKDKIRNLTRVCFGDELLLLVTWEGTYGKSKLKDSPIIECIRSAIEDCTMENIKSFIGPYMRNAPRRLDNKKNTAQPENQE